MDEGELGDRASLLKPSFEQIDAFFARRRPAWEEWEERVISACENARHEINGAGAEEPFARAALDAIRTLQKFLPRADDTEEIHQHLTAVRQSLSALTESVGGAWEDQSEPLHEAYSEIVTAIYRSLDDERW